MKDAVFRQPANLKAAFPAAHRTHHACQETLFGQRRSLRGFLPFAGPAVIASVAYMDPGNFATNIQAGARYGYGLVWVVLLANLIAMLFQALSARLGIVTGQSLAALVRSHFRRLSPLPMWVAMKSPAAGHRPRGNCRRWRSASTCFWACRC